MNTGHDELQNLPTDPDALRALLQSMKSERDALAAERDDLLQTVERQQHLIRAFNRLQFGRKSERLPVSPEHPDEATPRPLGSILG